MPVYEKALTIPANTKETAPVETTLEIEGDTVIRLEMEFPDGCVRLAHVAVFYGIRQLWPTEAGTWLASNDWVISFPVSWDLPEPKTVLTIRGWNEDDTYKHTVTCRFVTAYEPVAKPWRVISDFVAILKRLMGIP